MNMGVRLTLGDCFSILLGMYLEVELLNHTAILCLIFRETSVLFSILAAPFYIHSSGAQGFQFLHILINTLFSGVFFFLTVAILMDMRHNQMILS